MKQSIKTGEEMLTPHFSKREMYRSGVAARMGYENLPGEQETCALKALCEHVLEPLRKRCGRIIIVSGYRCPKLNKKVHGSPFSQHLLGEAADIHTSSLEQAQRYMKVIQQYTDFDQLILERRCVGGCYWVHVSYRMAPEKNRHEVFSLVAE